LAFACTLLQSCTNEGSRWHTSTSASNAPAGETAIPLGIESREVGLDQQPQDRVAIRKVLVDRRDGHARRVGDLAHAHGIVALACDQLARRREQVLEPLAAALLARCAARRDLARDAARRRHPRRSRLAGARCRSLRAVRRRGHPRARSCATFLPS
jgi:hypothetical protein